MVKSLSQLRVCSKLSFTSLLSGLLLVFGSSLAIAESPDLSGRWYLDPKFSQDPVTIIAEGLKVFDPSALRVIKTRKGTAVLGDYIKKPRKEKVLRVVQLLDAVVPLVGISEISYDGHFMLLSYQDSRKRKVYTKERDPNLFIQSTAVNNDQKTTMAAWEDKRFIIETNTISGTKVIESYKLGVKDKAKVLNVHIAISSTKLSRPQHIKYLYRSNKIKLSAE